MATRLLLTLLALLTGLAAQIGPAQARGIGASEVAVAIDRRDVQRVARRPNSPLPVTTVFKRDPCTIPMLVRPANCAPAVMLRIDRAHE